MTENQRQFFFLVSEYGTRFFGMCHEHITNLFSAVYIAYRWFAAYIVFCNSYGDNNIATAAETQPDIISATGCRDQLQ